jgi:hypothetical protein
MNYKNKWVTADNKVILFSELSHQHVSNIIWYFELLFNHNHQEMRRQLNLRFDGYLLKFKPLPIENELRNLKKLGYITANGDIIQSISFNTHRLIGSVTHIPNWQELIK